MPDGDIDARDGEDEQITITADGATIMASEKISTGDYENATVSTTLELSIEGIDVSDGLPDELSNKLYGLKRALQLQTQQAAEERRPAREQEKREYEQGP